MTSIVDRWLVQLRQTDRSLSTKDESLFCQLFLSIALQNSVLSLLIFLAQQKCCTTPNKTQDLLNKAETRQQV